jgi:hypothetical protein
MNGTNKTSVVESDRRFIEFRESNFYSTILDVFFSLYLVLRSILAFIHPGQHIPVPGHPPPLQILGGDPAMIKKDVLGLVTQLRRLGIVVAFDEL